MIISMTGFGRSEVTGNSVTVVAEARSVNNRFLEISTRIPRELNHRENDMREIVRKILSRGKINLNVSIETDRASVPTFTVDPELVRSYKDALDGVRRAGKIRESVTLDHLLHFSDALLQSSAAETGDHWDLVAQAIEESVRGLETMRMNEGRELARDMRDRIRTIDGLVEEAEKLSKAKVPAERQRLRERIAQLFENEEFDESRLEFEIILLADKLDVTEECVRYRSHTKYFVEAMKGPEPAGRKLGFLLQEMNREITTIGSKSNDAEIAYLVVRAKEELEKIREQVQNIE